MAGSFFDQVEEMDALLLEELGDGLVDYLNRQAAVIVQGLPLERVPDVERLESGALDRFTVFCVQKARLQPFDRHGAFRDAAGKVWHIDGIAADDGHLITFYVRP